MGQEAHPPRAPTVDLSGAIRRISEQIPDVHCKYLSSALPSDDASLLSDLGTCIGAVSELSACDGERLGCFLTSLSNRFCVKNSIVAEIRSLHQFQFLCVTEVTFEGQKGIQYPSPHELCRVRHKVTATQWTWPTRTAADVPRSALAIVNKSNLFPQMWNELEEVISIAREAQGRLPQPASDERKQMLREFVGIIAAQPDDSSHWVHTFIECINKAIQ